MTEELPPFDPEPMINFITKDRLGSFMIEYFKDQSEKSYLVRIYKSEEGFVIPADKPLFQKFLKEMETGKIVHCNSYTLESDPLDETLVWKFLRETVIDYEE